MSSSSHSQEFPLVLGKQQGFAEQAWQRDPMARILLIHAGTCRLAHGSTTESMPPGTIAAIPAGVSHGLLDVEGVAWSLIRFDPQAIGVDSWAIARSAEFLSLFSALLRRGKKEVRVMHLMPRHMGQAAAVAGVNADGLSLPLLRAHPVADG